MSDRLRWPYGAPTIGVLIRPCRAWKFSETAKCDLARTEIPCLFRSVSFATLRPFPQVGQDTRTNGTTHSMRAIARLSWHQRKPQRVQPRHKRRGGERFA